MQPRKILDETSIINKPVLKIIDNLPVSIGEARKEIPNEIIYECSNDMQYLQQYFFIREYAYRLDLGLKRFTGIEDEVDQYSHIIIARQGHFCIGGARLTISTRNNPQKLPMESEKFRISSIFPEVATHNYCELGRVAVLPEYRASSHIRNIFKHCSEIALQADCKYMLGVSPPPGARRFSRVFRDFGFESLVREDILFPSSAIHEHLTLQPIVVRMH